jgi:hypothetical protein
MSAFAARSAGQDMASAVSSEPHAAAVADDDVLAAVLIRMWSLASGRILRSDVPPNQLTEEDLIRFWADDMTPPSGRHATLRPVPAGEAK